MTSVAETPAPPLAEFSPRADDRDDRHGHLERLVRGRRAGVRDLSFGAVGATANPTIVVDVWKQDPASWRAGSATLAAGLPARHRGRPRLGHRRGDVASRRAPLLEPAFEAHAGRQGRLSVQTDPTLFRTPDRMLAQGVQFTDPRAEHHREVPGDGGRHRRDRGGDVRAASASTSR